MHGNVICSDYDDGMCLHRSRYVIHALLFLLACYHRAPADVVKALLDYGGTESVRW